MIKPRPCKLMKADDITSMRTKWGRGVTNTITRGGWELCTSDLFHYYEHPLLASFFDSIHGDFGEYATLRTCRAQGKTVSDGTKRGAKVITTGNKIKLPVITSEQRVEIAIRTSVLIEQDERYIKWAQNWLAGVDKSIVSAWATYINYDTWAANAASLVAHVPDAATCAAWAVRDVCDAGINQNTILDIIYQVVNKEEK